MPAAVGPGVFFGDYAQVLLGAIGEYGERAIVRLVGGNLGLREPVAVYETIQVVLRPHIAIEVREHQAGGPNDGDRRDRYGRRGRGRGNGGFGRGAGAGGEGQRAGNRQGPTTHVVTPSWIQADPGRHRRVAADYRGIRPGPAVRWMGHATSRASASTGHWRASCERNSGSGSKCSWASLYAARPTRWRGSPMTWSRSQRVSSVRWYRLLTPRERQRAIALLDIAALGRPIGTDDLCIESVDQRVHLGIDAKFLVGPCGDDTIRRQHPPALRVKTVEVEPVRRLRRSDQRHRTRGHGKTFGRGADILDARVSRGFLDLRAACVDRDDRVEVCGKRHGRLAVAGGTVHRDGATRRARGDEFDELRRIAGPVAAVGRLRREMVLKLATSHRIAYPSSGCTRPRIMDGIKVVDIAHAIQLALAPVFLLSGIWVFLGVLTNRLARIVDRARNLENELRHPEARDPERIRNQLAALARRARCINIAITLGTIAALLIALVVALLFASTFVPLNLRARRCCSCLRCCRWWRRCQFPVRGAHRDRGAAHRRRLARHTVSTPARCAGFGCSVQLVRNSPSE